MLLARHFTLVYNIIASRLDIEVEHFRTTEIVARREGIVEGRIRFWDNSLFEFVEALVQDDLILVQVNYAYHFQDGNGQLCFRYDNAPHHPSIETFPHHKHVWDQSKNEERIEPAHPPQLAEVIREIDQILYG